MIFIITAFDDSRKHEGSGDCLVAMACAENGNFAFEIASIFLQSDWRVVIEKSAHWLKRGEP